VKEFLQRNEVTYVSHNVIADDSAFDDLTSMGLPRWVPYVVKGDDYADGQMLDPVADLVDIEYVAEPLPVAELRRRLNTFLDATQRFLSQLPEDALDHHIPNRPRSYAELCYHIFSLSDSFFEFQAGIDLNTYKLEPEWDYSSKRALETYGHVVQTHLNNWFDELGDTHDWSAPANVFYGTPTHLEFLERTTWHTGQHTRQLEWVLENEVGVDPEDPLGPEVRAGLPMPDRVWHER
jgi:hypothetical protein